MQRVVEPLRTLNSTRGTTAVAESVEATGKRVTPVNFHCSTSIAQSLPHPYSHGYLLGYLLGYRLGYRHGTVVPSASSLLPRNWLRTMGPELKGRCPIMIIQEANYWRMPGLATAHSHAFQRALRGRTQRRSTAASSFWSWRGLMYALAAQLDPDTLYALSRFAYMELALSGVTLVGEFHYVHHQPNGSPYANRTELADAVIRAATDVGIRICLIRTAYLRGGHEQPLTGAQARFADADVDAVLQDVETLRARHTTNPLVTVGVAAHSIRAVPIDQVVTLADYANGEQLPFHMHICEQRRELAESVDEHGVTPVTLLHEQGVLTPNFVGVHGTHLSAAEIAALGDAGSMICLCRTTERDLGDGLPASRHLLAAGVPIAVGVDSHACADAFEEIRAVELDERSRLERRHAVADGDQLLQMGTANGYRACGVRAPNSQEEHRDQIWLRADDPALAGLESATAADGILFAATPRAVAKVEVAGRTIIDAGWHADYTDALHAYQQTLRKLAL